MLTKRIIPCLDVRDGKVVKGVNFVGIQEVGDPVEMARSYSAQQADELVFLDINASYENRETMLEVVRRIAAVIDIPFTVGGGIGRIEDIQRVLQAGADKVGINSAAVRNPALINQGAKTFGRERIVCAIDGKGTPEGSWHVVVKGGREDTGREVVDWAKEVETRGAGEILLTSMDADGTQGGFDLDMTRAVCEAVNIPVIASGGAGTIEDFSAVFRETGCDAALAASIFHYEKLRIADIKTRLLAEGFPIGGDVQ